MSKLGWKFLRITKKIIGWFRRGFLQLISPETLSNMAKIPSLTKSTFLGERQNIWRNQKQAIKSYTLCSKRLYETFCFFHIYLVSGIILITDSLSSKIAGTWLVYVFRTLIVFIVLLLDHSHFNSNFYVLFLSPPSSFQPQELFNFTSLSEIVFFIIILCTKSFILFTWFFLHSIRYTIVFPPGVGEWSLNYPLIQFFAQ